MVALAVAWVLPTPYSQRGDNARLGKSNGHSTQALEKR
jgi:hypothetical protein